MVLWGLRQAGWVCKHYSIVFDRTVMKVKIRLCEPGGLRTAAQTWLRSQGPWKEIPLHSCLLWLNQFWVNMLRFAIYIYIYTYIYLSTVITPISTFGGCSWVKHPITDLIKYTLGELRASASPPSWCDGGGSWWNVGHDAAKSFGSEFMVYPWVILGSLMVPVPPIKNGRDGRNGLNESSLWCLFIVGLVFYSFPGLIARSSDIRTTSTQKRQKRPLGEVLLLGKGHIRLMCSQSVCGCKEMQ